MTAIKSRLTTFIIVLFLLSPYAQWYPGARYSDLLIFPLLTYLALGKSFYTDAFYIMLIGGIFAMLSVLFYASFNGLETSKGDYVFPLFWLRYALIYSIFNSFEYNRRRIINVFVVSQLLLVVAGVLQWNNYFDFASLIKEVNVWDRSAYAFQARGHWRRAYVFSTNSNYYAFLLLSCFLPILLHRSKIILGLMLFVTLLGLFVAGSRSAIFAFLFIATLFYRRKALIFATLLIPTLVYTIINSGLAEYRLFDSDSISTSYFARLRDLISPLILMTEQPLSLVFGFGPLKEYFRSDSHNGWTWILVRTGLVGFLIYIAFLRKIINIATLNAKRVSKEFRGIYLMIPIGIGELTQNIFKDTYTFEVFMVVLVIISKIQVGYPVFKLRQADMFIDEMIANKKNSYKRLL